MKPNFALSLSFDGIRLIHRSGTGWTIVGDVALDSPDMAGELAMLRKTALALDPAGLRTKVLIPNDQIKYLALDTTRATEDDVKHKLDGATPYPVSDLAYDFVRGGGRTYIAAVARETLDEAEAFASEHRFGPVCFAGVPEEFTFVGEAFFGPTKAAATLLPPGEKVERDGAPVKVQTKTTRPAPVMTAPALPVADKPLAAATGQRPEAVTPIAPPATTPPAPETRMPAKAVATQPEIIVTPKPLPESPEEASDSPILSVPADTVAKPESAGASPILKETTAPEPASPEIVMPTPEIVADTAEVPKTIPVAAFENAAVATSAPVDAAPVVPADLDDTPVFSSRARSQRAVKDTGPALSDSLPPAAPLPVSAPVADKATTDLVDAASFNTSRAAAPIATTAPAVVATTIPAPPAAPVSAKAAVVTTTAKPPSGLAVPVARPVAAPPLTGTGRVTIDTIGLLPRGLTATATKPGTAPAVTGLSEATRSDGAVPGLFKTATAIAEVAATPAKKPVLPGAGNRLLVDDDDDLPPMPADPRTARKPDAKDSVAAKAAAAARPARTKPRFLGLILTVVLILALFAVAAWATIADTVVSRWLGFGNDEVMTATADAVAVPIAIPVPGPDTSSPEIAFSATDTDASVQFGPEQGAPSQSTPGQLAVDQVTPERALSDAATTQTAVVTETMPSDLPEDTVVALPATDRAAATPLDDAAAAAAAVAVATAVAGLAAEPAIEPEAAELPAETAAASPSLSEPVSQGTGTIVTPEEAERFYAATGVWLRAPRLPLLPTAEDLDGLYTAALDGRLAEREAVTLTALGTDVGLVPQLNPPAPGTRFARDDRGFILATPEGTLTPDGLLVFAGQPAISPPTRPGTVAPAGSADVVADATIAPVPEAAPAAPSLRPSARPESITTQAALAAEPDAAEDASLDVAAIEGAATDAATQSDAATAGGVTLAGLRPRERPGDVALTAEDTTEAVTVAFDGPRPTTRPDGLAPEGATSSPETEVAEAAEPADPVSDVSAALAAIVDGAADPLAGATAQAVAVASRPDARPSNFSRVVEQQTARLARAQPAADPPASASTAGNLSREEQAETEPEVASNAAAASSGPIPGGVASAATFEDVMALREINLIGVYGQPSARRALVRLANGRYLRVEVGDSLDGGQVAAISDSALNYVRRGRTITLEIPGE